MNCTGSLKVGDVVVLKAGEDNKELHDSNTFYCVSLEFSSRRITVSLKLHCSEMYNRVTTFFSR